MVHVGALPGTPHATTSLHALEHAAVGEARILAEAGFDAIIVENMHDRPYMQPPHPPETVAAMTIAVHAVRAAFDGPLGV